MRVGCKSRSGIRIYLRHYRIGGRLYTTSKDLEEFFTTLADADLEYFKRDNQTPSCLTVRHRTELRQNAAIQSAQYELDIAGL